MQFSIKRKISLGYILAFILLLFSYFLLLYSTWQVRRITKWVSHTYIIIANVQGLKASISEAETGARGYVITKDERFLAPYTNSQQTIPRYLKDLRVETVDNERQQQRMDTLDWLVKKRMGFFEFGLTEFKNSGFTITEAMRANWQDSRITTDSIRLYLDMMKKTEEELLEQRKAHLSGLTRNIQLLIIVSLITALISIGYSLILYSRENKKASRYRNELEENIAKLTAINSELTELRSMEKFAATGRIARTIAHEVRNPLTNIALAGEQLQELAVQNNESTTLLAMINRNAARINQLVSDLLNATKSMQLELSPISLNQLLDDTLELATDRMELKKISLEKNYDPKVGEVMVDTEKMSFAFLNIIVNAIEAMEKNEGMLRIATKQSGDKYVVEITDNGKGMNEETLSKIFEPYFTGKLKGNGLGLTNTQNIILSHKGNIQVISQPDEGTTFIVTLNKA